MVDKPHKKKNADHTQGSTEQMLFPDPENNVENEEEDRDQQEYEFTHKHKVSLRGKWKRTATYNKFIAVAAVVSAASTLAYAIFALLQWNAMSAQLQEIRSGSADTHALAEAAKKQSEQAEAQTKKMSESLQRTDKLIGATSNLAREAKRSADIAQNSMNASLAASHLDERPWVGMVNMNINPIAVDKKIIGTIQIRNTGKTIALNVDLQGWIHLSPSLVTELEHPNAEGRGSVLVIFPNQDISISPAITRLPKEAEVKALKERQEYIYLYARISYVDVFGKKHHTEICGLFDGESSFNACSFHNSAD